jgi:hypothetical protein
MYERHIEQYGKDCSFIQENYTNKKYRQKLAAATAAAAAAAAAATNKHQTSTSNHMHTLLRISTACIMSSCTTTTYSHIIVYCSTSLLDNMMCMQGFKCMMS